MSGAAVLSLAGAVAQLSDPAQALQNRASDPRHSAWVSANAGSGKTFVLARRVVRLLLADVDPSKILCLTFTKAAAAEMAKRVFDDLAAWVPLDDAALAGVLTGLEGTRPDAKRLAAARRLFARALETPGGLKLQTIHAFCERLLHQFPFEANVAGHFEVLEENAALALLAEARRAVLARAAVAPESRLGSALRVVVAAASDRGHEDAIAEFAEKRDQLHAWIVAAHSVEGAIAQLRSALGLAPGDDVASVRHRAIAESPLGAADIARLVAVLERSGIRDADSAARLRPFLTATTDEQRIAAYLAYFLVSDGKKARAPGGLAAAAVTRTWPGLDDILTAECARIGALIDVIAVAGVYEQSAAMVRLADAVLQDYDRLKTGRGFLDFDDLVVKTAALLDRSDAATWVQYKLDQGLDHILVDEAQDTSPRQWAVIKALAEDFFAGASSRPGPRTVFAVGDEKQSIYSFQGAVPAWFARVRDEMAGKAAAAGGSLRKVDLLVSRRSTPDILGAVDRIFAPPEAHAGLSSEGRPQHEAHRRGQPGRVVLWPMLEDPPLPDPGEWHLPLDHMDHAAPEAILAERIALRIQGWRERGERIEATGRPIRPGGILILTRKRGRLSEAINRALKRHGVPVAGADRLALAGHIAVMDLLALGAAMLLPEDDLTLATVLRGPLLGLDEEALFALAYQRPGNLWEALAKAANAEPFATAFRRFTEWRRGVDYTSPYAFFARVLGPDDGRRQFAARLGVEAEDVLDEFLAQALAYERVETPSLEGFLAWMRATATEIKRETELLRDEVRVMTVHGAKGLEADIVFVVDDGSQPAHQSHAPSVVALSDDPDTPGEAPIVWVPRGAPERVKAVIAIHKRRAIEEYRRLLYVALTRARDRLYICGTRKKNTDAATGWHALVTAALGAEARTIAGIGGAPDELEWRADWSLAAAMAAADEAAPPAETSRPLPEWTATPPPTPRLLRTLNPSRAIGDADQPATQPAGGLDARAAGGRTALERGRIVHRLLEALPEQPEAERHGTAAHYVAAVAPHWPAADRDALVGQVLAILADPAFAPVFAPGSRAEVAIAGLIPVGRNEQLLSGRIDRLAVTSGRVLIVDYKTNRPAPEALAAVPPLYLAQLALYRSVLLQLYPGRPVEAALLWTDVPRLMPVPPDALEGAVRNNLA